MQMTISGHHLDITNPMRDYVTNKLSKLERHYEQITSITVMLTIEKLQHKAEATVHVSGAELFAISEHVDMYAAIDALADKLDRQLIKHKRKKSRALAFLMKITDVLIPEMTQCDLAWPSKKRVLQNLSSLVSEHLGGDAEQADSLFHSFVAREKLGSTSIGDGVAILIVAQRAFKRIHGCLITLQNPINFDAYDDQPVDLIFALVVPEEKNDEHLATLARIAALMQKDSSRQLLRACQNNKDLYNTAVRLERSN